MQLQFIAGINTMSCKVTCINPRLCDKNFIKGSMYVWYGHIQRMEEGRLPKKVIKWSPTGRRKRGRPKLTWAEEIRGLMEEKGLMEEDWNYRHKCKKKII